MRRKPVISFALPFLGFLFGMRSVALATVYCIGSGPASAISHSCVYDSLEGEYYCSESTTSWTASCVDPGCKRMDLGSTDDTGCNLSYDKQSCDIKPGGHANYTQSGCSYCDDTVCKDNTTSSSQTCGSTTISYSCTNECGGTKTWTETGTCRECQTENACGTTNWDCKTATCNECEDCSPACGQTKDCGGTCLNTDNGAPTVPSCGAPNGQEVTTASTTINWGSGGAKTEYYNYRVDYGTTVYARNTQSVTLSFTPGAHTWQADAINTSCATNHSEYDYSGWTSPACSFCYETGPTLTSWTAWPPATCGSATRSRTCSETCGTDDCPAYFAIPANCPPGGTCTVVGNTQVQTRCTHCAPTLSDWGMCDSNHKRRRTCTDNDGACDGNDCASVILEEDCVGTIQGALFDASEYSSCPADLISNPGNYSDVLIANRQFNMLSPFGLPSWPDGSSNPRTLTTNNVGFYSLTAYAPGSSYTYDFSALEGTYTGVNDPKLKCTSAAAGLPGCSTADATQPCSAATLPNMSFGFWRVYGGWWQAVGGSVYAETGLRSRIPASIPPLSYPFPNQKLLVSDGARTGILVHGFGWRGTELGTNPNADVSETTLQVKSVYDGLRYDYNFFKTRMDVFPSSTWTSQSIENYDDGGVGYMIFKSNTDVTIGEALNVNADKKAILLVDGDVSINANVFVASGSFFAIIASGTITYSPGVTSAQGWYVADSIYVPCAITAGACNKTDVQFEGQGSFVGWSGINLYRDMAAENNNNPSEKFIYRPDFLLNAPTPIRVYSKKYSPFIP